ncbi:hypothetical protein EBQ74_08015 [bacterium]|nr:hypothetical protein [bacterium]
MAETLKCEDFPEVRLISGLLALKDGKYGEASDFFLSAKSLIETEKVKSHRKCFPPEYFEIWLYWARSLDLLGKREEAVKEYSALSEHSDLRDQTVKKIALAKKPYRIENLDRIIMPYSSYLPFT